MSGTEEVPAATLGEAPSEELAGDGSGNALSSKSSDISIEEIGPEDSAAAAAETADNAEVLIPEVDADKTVETEVASDKKEDSPAKEEEEEDKAEDKAKEEEPAVAVDAEPSSAAAPVASQGKTQIVFHIAHIVVLFRR